MNTTLEPMFLPPAPRPSLRRRLIDHGIGAFLALGYWSVAGVLIVLCALFIAIAMGPALIALMMLLGAGAYGFGLFLCAVAGLLTIHKPLRRPAVAFLIGSAVANVGLVALVVLLFAASALIVQLT